MGRHLTWITAVSYTHLPVCARGIARLADQGMLIALGGINGNMSPRAECLWAAYEMLKVMKDPEKVLPMITSVSYTHLDVYKRQGFWRSGKTFWTEAVLPDPGSSIVYVSVRADQIHPPSSVII